MHRGPATRVLRRDATDTGSVMDLPSDRPGDISQSLDTTAETARRSSTKHVTVKGYIYCTCLGGRCAELVALPGCSTHSAALLRPEALYVYMTARLDNSRHPHFSSHPHPMILPCYFGRRPGCGSHISSNLPRLLCNLSNPQQLVSRYLPISRSRSRSPTQCSLSLSLSLSISRSARP